MSYSNENPEIYEEFSQKYKFSIKVLNSIKEISLLKEKYGDSNKNSYSSSIPKSQKNFRINFNKFASKTKPILEFPIPSLNTLKLTKDHKPLKNKKVTSLLPFSKTFTESFPKQQILTSEERNPTIFESKVFDEIMGEPFISIKIDHLTNYKEEPLKYYDLQALNDLDLKEIINLGAVDGYSRWVSNDGSVKWRLCLIKGYDAENQMFCIQWKHNNKEKKVTRLNLMLKSENEAMFDTRRDLAKYNRYRLLYLESYKKSIKECFENLDFILYSIPQLKNIFDKVFTSESKLDAFNNQDNLIEMLDEIFDDFKYETLRFLLEWKNTNGNIKEILKIREIHPSKVFLSNKNKTSLKNSTIVIANYIENEDFNSNIYVKSRMSYQQKSEESEDFQTKIRILAYGFPYHLKKIYDVNMNYYKLAEKSVKYLTEKPKKLFSIDFPLIVSTIKSLENLNLFESLKDLAATKVLLTLEEFFKYKDDTLKAVSHIDKIFFKIEKIIEDIEYDLDKEKNLSREKKVVLIERVKKTVKVMINSSLFATINNSVSFLKEFLEKYNAVLPFAKISSKMANLLPFQIFEKRSFFRKKYHLLEDGFIKTNNENASFEENEKKYDEIISSVLEELYEGLISNSFHANANLKIENLTIPPFLQLEIQISDSFVNAHKKSNKEIRYELRNENRNVLKNKIEKLLKKPQINKQKMDNTAEKTEFDEIDVPKVLTMFEKEFKLDWILFKIEPKISNLEDFLRDFIITPLFKIKKLKQYSLLGFGKTDDFNYVERLRKFLIEINHLFRYEFFPLISLLLVFNSFEYLILQKKTLLTDLMEFEQASKNLNVYTDEILKLSKDKEFLIHIPHLIRVGIFNVKLERVRFTLLENCEYLLNQLKSTLIDKFVKLVRTTEEKVSNIILQLETQPNTIDEFLEIKEFIKGEELESCIKEIKGNIETITKLVDAIEESQIEYNADIFQISFVGRIVWTKNLEAKIIDSEKILENSRVKFFKILEKQKKDIMDDFEFIKNEIESFKYYYDIGECFRYNSNAKNIMAKLTNSIENIKQLNKYEDVLQYGISDLNIVEQAFGNFEKYYLLWEFIAEKWRYRSENWMKSPFEILDEKEMTETISEGSELLNSLEKKMKDNTYIVDVIKNIMSEINKFSSHLGVIILLKEESFRERHWQLLWNELYVNITNKPDHKTITLERLLQDKLMNYVSTIYKLSNSAKMEFKIEVDINKIEESLKTIIIKQGIFDVGEIYPFYLIKDIEFIINNLNTQYSLCRNMLSNSEYPEEFMVRLNSLEIMINETRKCFKLMHKIQNMILKMNPVLKLRDLDKILIKDIYIPFNKQLEDYKQRMEDINKKNMSYFLTNLIVETNSSSQNVTLEKNEQFQKHYQDIYDSLISIDDQLKELNKHVRSINNKLYFLSDTCLMEIYAYIYDEPLKALDLIKYCYEGLDDFIIKDKKIDSGDSPTKNSKIALEVIGFKNSFEESYIFDKILNLSEKQTSSLDFISYVMKYLDEQPHLIKKSFLGYFHNNLISNSFGWTIYCKTLLLSQEKFQNVFLFMEVCFYHNLTMALEMEAINKENILQTPAKKKYLLSDISDEENIRGHKLKFYYEKICNYLTDSKKCFEELKNDKNNKCEIINLIKYNQFIFQLIKYKDILELLINNNINESNNFDYLSLPKLSLSFEKEFLDKNLIKSQEVIENTINNIQKIYQKIPENHIFMETESDFLKLGVKNEFDLTITAMTYKVNYGYQPMLLCENWVYVPQSTNYMISLLACLSTASSSLISGGNKIGKKSILKTLASLLGRSYYILECFPEIEYNTINQIICGAVSTGIWLILSNISDLKQELLSSFSQNIFDLRKSEYLKNDTCLIGNTKIKIYNDWNVFATYTNALNTHMSKKFENLPKKLLESFRIVNYTTPEYIYIIRGYLMAIGMENSCVFAKKIILFFDLIVGNIGNKLFLLKQDIEKQDIKRFGFNSCLMRINLVQIVKILEKTSRNLFERKNHLNDIEIEKEIRIEIKSFLKCLISKNHWTEVEVILDCVFGKQQDDKVLKNKENLKRFKKILTKFLNLNGIIFTKKFYKYCKILVEVITQGNSLFICGKVGIGKSTLIKAAAYVISFLKKSKIVFSLHLINLDALTHEHLIQSDKRNSILDLLLLKCLTTGDRKDLIDFTTLSYSSDCVEKEENYFGKYDWIIFDQEYTQEKQKKLNFSEKIALMLNKKKYFMDGITCIFPDSLKFIYEVNTFSEFSPSAISDVPMLYVQDHSFSLMEEFKIWKKKTFSKQIYFQKHNNFLNKLFCQLYLPLHSFLLSLKKIKELTYYISKKFLLFNFLTFLDIFLNEERKLAISYNEIPISELHRLKTTTKTIIYLAGKRPFQQSHHFEEKNKRERIIFLNDFIKSKIVIPETVLEQREICNENKRKPILSCIESHFVFCMIWSNCCFVSENSKIALGDFLLELLNKFIIDNDIEKTIFANGLLSSLEIGKYTYNELFYDMGTCQWILWRDTKMPDYPTISNNYNANLEYAEMVRLNPLIADIPTLKKFMGEKEIQMNALPNLEEQQFIVNDITKKCKYFLDYLLGYDISFLVTSNSQAGKTTVIKYKIKKMLEQNVCKVISLSLTGNTKAETLSRLIELKLIKKTKGIYTAGSLVKSYIFIDDLNLIDGNNSIIGMLRTVREHSGWFSYLQKSYFRIENLALFGAFSFTQESAINTFNSKFNSIGPSVMQKYTVFNMDDLNGRNLMTVFNSLNENLFEDHMDEPFEYLLAKALIQEILNAKLLLHRVSKVYEVNTSLNQFFSIIKSLQLFEWSEIFTEKQIANTFLYCINNGLGDCFLANKMEGIYSELIDNNENSGSDEESSDSEAENELQSSSALKDQLKKKESLSPQRNSIIPNFTSVIPQNVGSDDCLQSPINNTGRLTLTKKLVSFASHNKSIQISESSSEEINNDEKDELEEEEADLVGDLPTKHGIISPETLILEPDLKNLDNQRKEEKAGSLEIQEKHKLRQRIYDQTNTSFKISLQKSQSLSTIKNRKSSILDFTEMNFGKEKETLDVRTFLPIQEFCTFGVGDLFKNMIESSKKTKKKAEKLVKIIERRNQRMVFDYNMLDIKNEEEINSDVYLPGFNFIEKQNTNQIEKFFQHKLKIFIQNTPTMMLKLKCFRENAGILYYDTWKNVFDLRIPYQNLLLKCFSNTEYAEASVEFAAFILDMPVFKAKLNGNSHYGMLFYQEFSTQLANLLENCIIDDKKVVYLIIFNLKMGDTIVDNEDPILKQILNIFEDINSILTGSELYKVFPKQLIKDLIFHIKRMDLYNNLNESQLYSVITQRLISNIKFTIIFENSYFISNSQTKSTQKSIFNILYNEYPQTFQKFKTKTIEEFLIKPTHINIDLGVATFLKKPDFPIVKKVNDFCLVFELDIVKILKTANKNATISNYDENYLMTVYLWELLQTKMKKKGTDEDMKILSPSLKSMARKIEDLEKEIMELRKYIEERKIETEKVDKNITEIKLKRGYLLEEINELTNKSIKLNQNLNGYLNEENIQKKLINTFVESVKTISNLQTKDYVSEITSNNYMNQKLFAFYSVLFCLLFNYKLQDKNLEEFPKFVKEFEGSNMSSVDNKFIHEFVQEFSKIIIDFNQFKQLIVNFKMEMVTEARLKCLTKIIEDVNIMTHYSTRYTRIQKLVLKWIDLAIENAKFNFRNDLRYRNITSLKESIETIDEENFKRKEFLVILDKETEEQPILLEKINEKLNLDQISLEQKIIIRKELKKYPKQIEQIVKNYYEKINPIYSKEELIKDYLLLACIYILQINKYSYTIKKKFTQSLSENCFSDISFENYDVHELLFNDTYFLEFTKLPIIINRNLINNYAIYEFISQQLFLFPLILDPVGLFCSCFRMKNKDGKWMIDLGHLDSKSQELIEEACEKGRKLIIKDFDAGLLALIMPILVWRKEKVMRKIMDIIYLNNSQNLENEEIDENNLLDLNGKTIKIHPNFQLILIISDSSKFLSQSLLENVVIINNDIGDKEIWNETLLNLIVKKCSYKEENNKIMDQLLEGKSKNKLMIEYKKLLNLLKNLNMIDLSLNDLNEMKSILEVLNIFLLQDDEKEPEKEKVNSPNLQKKLSKESELNRENNEEKSLQSPDKNQERIKTGETLQNIPKNPSKVAFEIKSPDYLGKYHEGNLRNTNFDSLLKKLELIRIILEQIMHIFGDLYEFSEDYYFNVVNQALEVVIFNGYSNDKFESMMELFLYQLVLTSLKEDHQSLFSFYYSFYFLKEIGQHNKLLWNFFIQGPIQNSDKTIWFQSSKISENWENLKQVLQESFKITDCNLPQLNIKNNEYIDIKFKRDIENSSSLIQKNKMITEPKLQSSETIPSLNNTNIPTNNNNSNSSFFFPTEANIEGKTKNEEFQNNSLKKRTKNKSSTLYLNVNIPDSSVQKGKYKNYDRKIELLSPYFNNDKISFIDIPKISVEPLMSANKFREIKKKGDSNFLSNVASILESNEEYIHKISKQFENKITINVPDTLCLESNEKSEIKKHPSLLKSNFSSLINKEDVDFQKKTFYFKSIAAKFIISKVSENFQKKISNERFLISKSAWEALNKLSNIVPNPFRKVISNIELQPKLWNQMLFRANINLKDDLILAKKELNNLENIKLKRNFTTSDTNTSNSKEFCGIKLPLDNLLPLDILTIVKYIRPDALEYVAKTVISTVRHSAFYYISKQNLETFARVSNCFKPNLILFNVKKWNPSELIEMTASRNNVRLIKFCLGTSKINEILDMISTAAGSGSWILLENLHSVKKNNIKEILKKISYEMEWNLNDSKFRVWFTYQVSNESFKECNFKKNNKDYLKPLFQTSTKYFVNFNLHIQQSLYDFHQSQLNDFFAEVDVEASQKTITIPIKKGFKGLYLNTISEYRQKLLENQKQNTLSLESFIIKKRNSPKLEKTSRFPIENKPSIRYSFYFFLSILKMRQLYEDPLIQNYHHSNIFNYSEYDLQYKLDDFFNFLSKYPQNIYETFKSFFIKMFDEAQFNWFHSFNPIVFESFYKEILKPIEKHKHVEISVKNSNYLFLPLGRNQSKDIFEYIINTPPEDPIEIFSLNRNHEFSYNYNRSKNFFEYVVKNHYELEYKFTSQKETAFLNEVNPSFNQENLNENVRDFLDFLTESFTATVDSPLMNLINLLTKIVKIFGDEIKIEKIDLFSKMFQENLEDNESLNEDKNDISLIDDPDDKKDGISEENSKSSLSKIKDFEKSQILDENLSSINIDSFREKNGISLNFGKSNLILKRKRDVNNEMNEKSIELDEENSPETSLKKISTVKKRREIKFNDIFKSIILNEILIHNNLLILMKTDLEIMLEFLKGNCSKNLPKNLAKKLSLIQKNIVPHEWWVNGPCINSTVLFDYIKSFLIKQDLLFNLIYDRKCEISPILPLSKMFDPLDVFTSFLFYYAKENKCSIYDLQIQLIKSNTNIIPIKQPEKDFVNINGLKLKNGKMNMISGFLEEENIREFEFPLPMFAMTISRKKNINYKIHLTQPAIASYIGFKSLQSFHFDIEEEFLRGIENLEKDSYENYEIERKKSEFFKMEKAIEKNSQEKKIKSYFVRIPIFNPCYKNSLGNLTLKYDFYFKSLKPQSYWMKRNSMIVFE